LLIDVRSQATAGLGTPMRIATNIVHSDELLSAFLELERVTRED